jgi:hypothetical protein
MTKKKYRVHRLEVKGKDIQNHLEYQFFQQLRREAYLKFMELLKKLII